MPAVATPAATHSRSRLNRQEKRSLYGIAMVVLGLHVLGWGLLLGVIVPQHLSVGSAGGFGIGLGVSAYILGMRHAFDADHIAAIDNTTRKLMEERKRPLSVGFWFSLGHSSVVFALCLALAVGVRALAGEVESESSQVRATLGLVGTGVSAAFLYLIAAINLVILVGIVNVFRSMRTGVFDEHALEDQLNNRGLLSRILGRATRAIRKPWHMYPLGLLFGLGFDTATEVGLLVLAGGAASFALPWYAILTLPVLFAAGMSLLDSIDGCFMNFAYGWAFSKPVRKVYYNITITGLSVAVALIIGTIEVISILADRLGITHGPLATIGRLDLNYVGYTIVGLFLVTWLIAVTVWHVGDIEAKWEAETVSSE